MSFRVNDYNAFLSSLYERGSQNIPPTSADLPSNFNPPALDLSLRNQPDGGSEQISTSQQDPKLRSDFPMDFDLGLLPAQVMKEPVDPMDSAQFALETSLPDQNFDLFTSKEEQPLFRAQYNEPTQALVPSMQIKSESQPYDNILMHNDEVRLPSSSRQSSLDTENTPYVVKPSRTNSFQDKTAAQRPRAKSLHNLIEQRYRNKINDRFELLQECVPTLRVVARKLKKEEDEDEELLPPDLEGLEPARKISKGTILTKLVEYIKFLETKNLRLKQQQEELITRARMLGLDISSLNSDCFSP